MGAGPAITRRRPQRPSRSGEAVCGNGLRGSCVALRAGTVRRAPRFHQGEELEVQLVYLVRARALRGQSQDLHAELAQPGLDLVQVAFGNAHRSAADLALLG